MKKSEIISYAARLKKLLRSEDPAAVEQGLALAESLQEPELFDRLLDGLAWSPSGPGAGRCNWLKGGTSNPDAHQTLIWRLAGSAPPGSVAGDARAAVTEVPRWPLTGLGFGGDWMERYPNLERVHLSAALAAEGDPVSISLPQGVTSLSISAAVPHGHRANWRDPDLSALAGHPSLRALSLPAAGPSLLAQIADIEGLESLAIRLRVGAFDADLLAPLARLTNLRMLILEVERVYTNKYGRTETAPLAPGESLDLSPLSALPLEALRLIGWATPAVTGPSLYFAVQSAPQNAISDTWAPPRGREWKIGWKESFSSMGEALVALESHAGDAWRPIPWPDVDLAPLGAIASLKRLVIQGAPFGGVQSLGGLAGLADLESLHLMDLVGLQDLSALAGMGALKTLQLHGAGAASLAGVEGCVALEHVTLSHCTALADATALAALPLTSAHVSKCAALKPRPKGVDMTDAKLEAWKKSLARALAKAQEAASAQGAAPRRRSASKKKKAPSPRTLMRPIAKALKARSWAEIVSGVAQARALANPEVYALLLDGVALDDEGALVPSSRFVGADIDTLYRSWALYALVADSVEPSHAALRDGLRVLRLQIEGWFNVANEARDLPGLPFLGRYPALETLAFGGWRAVDLSGLPALASLGTLSVLGSGGYRSDPLDLRGLDAVAAQPALASLTLTNCRGLGALGALEGHGAVRALSLEGSDVTALPTLPALETLDVRRCAALSDVSALAAASGLRAVALDGNPALLDLSPLAAPPALSRVGAKQLHLDTYGSVELSDLGGRDLSPLLPAMCRMKPKALSIRSCGVTALPDLTGLGSLEVLKLSALHSLSSLAGADAPSLTRVALANLPGISSLAGLGRLQNLELSKLGLSSLEGLRVDALEMITLWSMSALTSLSALAGAPALQRVILRSSPGISDLSALAGLPSLTSVELSAVSVTELSPLASCPALETLQVDRSVVISGLAPLAGCGDLKRLSLPGNAGVWDLSPLAGLSSLETLNIFNCDRVTDLSPLAACVGLKRLHVNRNTLRAEVNALAAARPDLDIRGEH